MGFMSKKNDVEIYSESVFTRTGLYNLFIKRSNQTNTDPDPIKPVWFVLYDTPINYNLYNRSNINPGFDAISNTGDNNYDDIKNTVLLEPIQNDVPLNIYYTQLFGFKNIIPNVAIASNSIDTSSTVALDNNPPDASLEAQNLNAITQYSDPVSLKEVFDSQNTFNDTKFIGTWNSPINDTINVIQSTSDPNNTLVGIDYSVSFIDGSGNTLVDSTMIVTLNIFYKNLSQQASINLTNVTKYNLTMNNLLLAFSFKSSDILNVLPIYSSGIYEISITVQSQFGKYMLQKKTIVVSRKEHLPENFVVSTQMSLTSSLSGTVILAKTNPLTDAVINNLKNRITSPIQIVHPSAKKIISFNASENLISSDKHQLSNYTKDITLRDYIKNYYNNNIFALFSPFTLTFSIPPTSKMFLKLRAWNTKEELLLLRMETRPNTDLGDDSEYILPIGNTVISLKIIIVFYTNYVNYYIDNSFMQSFATQYKKIGDSIVPEEAISHIVYQNIANPNYITDIYYPSLSFMSQRHTKITASMNVDQEDISSQAFTITDDYNEVIIHDSGYKYVTPFDPLIFINAIRTK